MTDTETTETCIHSGKPIGDQAAYNVRDQGGNVVGKVLLAHLAEYNAAQETDEEAEPEEADEGDGDSEADDSDEG